MLCGMAFSLPLVRVEGKSYGVRPALSLTEQRFARGAPLDPEARDQTARDAEQRYGLGNCLYFYAGYACPDFGNIVLIYEPTIANDARGNASSFDTGGMFKRCIHGHGLPDDDARDSHVARDLCVLTMWEAQATTWIQSHFNHRDDYLDGNRAHTDDSTGRLLHPRNDRRAWTYEVRLHRPHDLFDRLVCAIVREDFWQAVLIEAGTGTADHQRMLALLGNLQIERVSSPDEPCEAAPVRIKAYANIAGGPP